MEGVLGSCAIGTSVLVRSGRLRCSPWVPRPRTRCERWPRGRVARAFRVAAASSDVYDVCVVGNGMTGTAAARHLALQGCKVAAVGPAERPRESWTSLDIFGAHYDEGRITRKTDPDPVWAHLAQRSIERYPGVEVESGIRFYYELRFSDALIKVVVHGWGPRNAPVRKTGHLAVSDSESPVIHSRIENANAAGIEYDSLDQAQIEERFPYLHFPGSNRALHERSGAGWVSARRQVDAQLAVAAKHGCEVVYEEVHSVERAASGAEEGGDDARYVITTANQIIHARKVLVSSGAFTNFRKLLPDGEGSHAALDLQLLTAQTVKVQLNEHDARRLESMPSVIFKGDDYWCYILPPIEYPDGNMYLKLGGGCMKTPQNIRNGAEAALPGLPGKQILLTQEEVSEWYRSGGDPQAAEDLMEVVNEIIPGLEPVSWHSDACVTCHTPSKQAYTGELSPGSGLVVLTGGNGLAAKSADELGRMGALSVLAEDGWGEQDLSRDIFEPRLRM